MVTLQREVAVSKSYVDANLPFGISRIYHPRVANGIKLNNIHEQPEANR